MWGANFEMALAGTAAFNNTTYGASCSVNHGGSGLLTAAIGEDNVIISSSTGGIATATALKAAIYNTGGGTIGTAYGLNIPAAINSGGGTIANLYGLLIGNQSVGGTLNYAIYTNAGLVRHGDQEELEEVDTIAGATADGYAAALTLDPGYTAATAQTVTRHNYIDVQNVSVAGVGPAAVTDACVFRFDANAGTHKAVDGATVKVTPGGVDAWVKININGTVLYVPAYVSKVA